MMQATMQVCQLLFFTLLLSTDHSIQMAKKLFSKISLLSLSESNPQVNLQGGFRFCFLNWYPIRYAVPILPPW